MGGIALGGELADQASRHGDGEHHPKGRGAAAAWAMARAGQKLDDARTGLFETPDHG